MSKHSLAVAFLVPLTFARVWAEEPSRVIVKWEYKIIGWQREKETQKLLNDLGEEGWECVAVANQGRNGGGDLILKRPKQVAPKPKLDNLLHQKITFVWKEGTLENALKALAIQLHKEDQKFDIEILGDDLKSEGITRNRHLRDLKFEDRVVAEVLTELLIAANPIVGVKEASDPDQKLIFIYADEPNGHTVLITTRRAAEERGDKLPAFFETK